MFNLKKKTAQLLLTSIILLSLSFAIPVTTYASVTGETGDAGADEEAQPGSTVDPIGGGSGGIIVCDAGAEITNNLEFSYTRFLETQAGLSSTESVTARTVELTESLPGGNVEGSDSSLIEGYKGVCCPSSKVKGNQCVDYIYVYTTDLDKCKEKASLCTPVQILVSNTGINLLKFYALQLYIWAASIVGIVAVLVIVVSGIQIAASRGEEALGSAKTRIMQSLAGLALLFLSALLLYTINPTFFVQ